MRLILGDQLNINHSWYRQPEPDVLYVIAELHQESTYVKHHIQKLCGFFAAMESFAKQLRSENHHVLHLTLDDTCQYKDLTDLIIDLCDQYSIQHFEYQHPDEYRLALQLEQLKLEFNRTITCCDTEHFYLKNHEFEQYLKPHKHNRMESFYRKMRKRFNVLMDGDNPAGGQWNFDAENRHKLKPNDIEKIPQPLLFANDVSKILQRINKHSIATIGIAKSELIWPINRQQSLQLLSYFCDQCLPLFGRFQDAMTCESDHKWSLFHARISFALNSKMLQPMEVIDTAIKQYEAKQSGIDLAQIEGFIRQIIGWREYIRGMYWINMPDYKELNQLNAKNPLPDYFWTGNTKMNCVKNAIDQSLEYAYAHHIQRLMVTGNFAMLAGIDPDVVDEWYLGIYIDAIEWVELPNTRGMSQFADGGLIATKPYAASGSYINKMGDYCKRCNYQVKEKYTENACPFNSLYWHFMNRHSEKFSNNPRTAMVYRNWNKMDSEIRQKTLEKAQQVLANLENI